MNQRTTVTLPDPHGPAAVLDARAAPLPPHNLPAQPAPLIGRDHDIVSVAARLRDPAGRLLTLTGPPGAGKTRLALAVAAAVLPAFPGGVWLTRLETVTDPEQVLPALAQTLGLRETGSRPLVDALAARLGEGRTLLLLDNFEQLLPAALALPGLLARCPAVTLLVTSRAPLRLRWEREMPVLPLALPDPALAAEPERVAASPAVRLFVERAGAVLPDFRLTAENAAAVAEICRRLDGLPLAIELAAARIKLLPPAALRDRLERRLPLLTGGARDLPARHQTLRAALAWSYDLLSVEEQAVFRALGAFAGGCSLAAAAFVAGPGTAIDDGEAAALDILAALLDHGLLRREQSPGGEPRFHLLETVREYAAEQLARSDAAAAVHERHAAWFLALAERAETGLRGPEQGTWLARLEEEHANVRAALDRALASGDATTALRLSGALWRSWEMRGRYSEGRRLLERALDAGAAAPAGLRAKALNGAGCLLLNQGDHARAEALLEQCLDLRREAGDESGAASVLNNLALVAVARGDLARGRALHEECLAILRRLDDRSRIGRSLNNLALVVFQQGDARQAVALLEESLTIARALGDTWEVAARLGNLGEVALATGDLSGAAALLAESTTLFRALGDRRRLAECLEEIAALAAARRGFQQAARLSGAAEALRDALATPPEPLEQAAQRATVAAARAALGETAFAAAWSEGRALPLDEALDGALALTNEAGRSADEPAPPPNAPAARATPAPLPAGLTAREAEVLGLIASGATNREIAATLVLSLGTVERHIANLYAKIGARGRADATAFAIGHDLLPNRP